MYLENRVCTVVSDHTIEPVHAHCFTVEKAETTKFRSQDFHGYVAGGRAIAQTKKQD